jgi:hypothetical protein
MNPAYGSAWDDPPETENWFRKCDSYPIRILIYIILLLLCEMNEKKMLSQRSLRDNNVACYLNRLNILIPCTLCTRYAAVK